MLIVGAGWAGNMLLKDLEWDRKTYYEVVGFIDDDAAEKGCEIQGRALP